MAHAGMHEVDDRMWILWCGLEANTYQQGPRLQESHARLGRSTCWHEQEPGLELGLGGDLQAIAVISQYMG